MKTISFEAIGTSWKIDLPDVSFDNQIELLIRKRIETYDLQYSRFRSDSYLWSLSQQQQSIPLDHDGKELFTFYKQLYDLTDGLVTPLIGSTLSQAGYDKDYSLVSQTITSPPSWEESFYDDVNHLHVKQPVIVDIGAAGKGQLIDVIGSLIEDHGITTSTIDAGGDIRYRSNKPLTIGLEDPNNPNRVIGVANIYNQSICGSAGNRRSWGTYHHIFNPKTLAPVTSVLATWVIAETTMLADGMSTALFFVDPQILLAQFHFDYVILYPDYSVSYSKHFNGEIF